MNWLDILIFVCIIIGIIHGWVTGIIKQIISLISLVVAILLSGTIAKTICHWADSYLQNINNQLSATAQSVIYYIIAFILILSLFALAAKLVDKIINHTPVGLINRLSGALFGVFLWTLCLSIALNCVATFDTQSRLIKTPVKENSIFYKPVKMLFPTVFPYIQEFLKK